MVFLFLPYKPVGRKTSVVEKNWRLITVIAIVMPASRFKQDEYNSVKTACYGGLEEKTHQWIIRQRVLFRGSAKCHSMEK